MPLPPPPPSRTRPFRPFASRPAAGEAPPPAATDAAPVAPPDPAPSAAGARARLRLWLDLIRWDRPAGWLLLLWPTLAALWLAAGGWPGGHLLAVFTLGTVLMRSAGCCINDVADRDFDRHVQRTAQRPVTTGRIAPREALGVGAALALLAFALVLTTNAAAVAWSVVALAVTVAYPYAKRVLAMPQAVLGVAFSLGMPMAFAAVQGGRPEAGPWWSLMPAWGWALWLGNLAWVLAYDTEYAMVDRDDDRRIGIRTSALTLGRWDVAGVMSFYAVFLALWGAVGWTQGLGAGFALGWAAAAGQVLMHFRLIRGRTRAGCFAAFRANHWVGASLFAGLALDLALR